MSDNIHNPPTLENFEEHQKKYLKLLEQFPMYRGIIAASLEPFLKKVIAKGCFYIRVHERDLPTILADGRLKNIMETGHSASMGGKEHRVRSTDALFGCHKENLKPEDYPKFGYLSTADGLNNVIQTYDMRWCCKKKRIT